MSRSRLPRTSGSSPPTGRWARTSSRCARAPSKRPLDPAVAKAFLRPLQTDRRIRRDVTALLRGISNRHTLEAAARFGEFDKPVLLAWAPDDRFFKLRYGERMAEVFPNARLERIEDSYTFVSIDQPARTAELIASFARVRD